MNALKMMIPLYVGTPNTEDGPVTEDDVRRRLQSYHDNNISLQDVLSVGSGRLISVGDYRSAVLRRKRRRKDILDIEYLQWIHDRLISHYGEDKNVDFVIRLREIISKMSKVGPEDSTDELQQWADKNVSRIFRDGDLWSAVGYGFNNLAESPAGFGSSIMAAVQDLKITVSQAPDTTPSGPRMPRLEVRDTLTETPEADDLLSDLQKAIKEARAEMAPHTAGDMTSVSVIQKAISKLQKRRKAKASNEEKVKDLLLLERGARSAAARVVYGKDWKEMTPEERDQVIGLLRQAYPVRVMRPEWDMPSDVLPRSVQPPVPPPVPPPPSGGGGIPPGKPAK